jgi:hypothetical protein
MYFKLISQSAADGFDGSKPAGSESEPLTRGCQLEATSKVGTIASSPDLTMGGALHLRLLERSGNTYTRCGPSSGLGAAERLLRTNDEPGMRPPPSLENMLKLSRTRSMANLKPRIRLPRKWKRRMMKIRYIDWPAICEKHHPAILAGDQISSIITT